ncbi:MAG: acyltransferase family protein [Bacteroidota bacterium]
MIYRLLIFGDRKIQKPLLLIEAVPTNYLKKEYRPELNGLRALAVLLVLFFHLDFSWMKGGFLGVDVFLVISGYFISRNILFELHTDSFSFLNFYTKRLRRLFPALIFVLVLVFIVGYFLLIPSRFERLAQSTFFSSLSISNFFFWSEAGYFDGASDTKPLLHMWSLSLEEQFYLFWPLILTVLYKYFRRLILWILLLLVVFSIGLSEYYFNTHSEATFFLLPFRIFEFVLGAVCLWLERFSMFRRKNLQEFLFFTGLLVIFYSAVTFDGLDRMPGMLSMLPVLGSVFIIIGGKAPIMAKVLNNKPSELIGKASYSIYLVHWPLIVYYKIAISSTLSLKEQLFLGIASLILGFIIWYFVENTFRYSRRSEMKWDRIWVGVPVLVLCLVGSSLYAWNANGLPSRLSDEVYMTADEIKENTRNYWKEVSQKKEILLGEANAGHVLVMGNSHAIDLIYALRGNGFKARITALLTTSKCYDFGFPMREEYVEDCSERLERNFNSKDWELVDAVYLHELYPKTKIENIKEILDKIRKKTKVPIFLMGPKMTFTLNAQDIVGRSSSNNPKDINAFAKRFEAAEKRLAVNAILEEEFTKAEYLKKDIYYVNFLKTQGGDHLNDFRIISNENSKFLYFDGTHFTKQGAEEFGKKLKVRYPYLFDTDQLNSPFK